MPSFVQTCMLLCACMGGMVCACRPQNYTFWVEKHNCTQCVAVNTTICSGYCFTQDTNLKGQFGKKFRIQRSCLPVSLAYKTAHVQGCPRDINPLFFYPMAHSCSCKRCDTRTHRCVRANAVSADRCSVTSRGLKTQKPTSEYTNINSTHAHQAQS